MDRKNIFKKQLDGQKKYEEINGCCRCMPFSTILIVNPGSPGL